MTMTLPLRAVFSLGALLQKARLMPSEADLYRLPVEKRRNLQPNKLFLYPRRQDVRREPAVASSGGGTVPVRIYRPASPSGRGLVYAHGGGWALGGLDACDHICAEIAASTGSVVISVDYRLAPEDPFPAGLDDVQLAFEWALTQGERLGYVPDRLSAGGDSAGGNLIAAMCLRILAEGGTQPARQVLLYPMLDLTCSAETWVSEALVEGQREMAVATLPLYFGDTGPKDPFVSPLFADDVAGLPEALIQTSEHDTLREDGRDYARLLRDGGVAVRHTEYARMTHGFLAFPRLSGSYFQCLSEIRDFLLQV